MAVYFPNSNSLLLLPPKTGSTWLRHTLREAKVFHILLGPKQLRGHGRLALYGREFKHTAAFIRHPVMWYHSYWRYRSKNDSWDERWAIDAIGKSPNFETFVSNVSQNLPGYLTQLFEEFTGPEDNAIDFIGKTENIREGLITFLNILDEKFEIEAIRSTNPMNVSGQPFIPTKDLCETIFAVETDCYSRHGYAKNPIETIQPKTAATISSTMTP